MIDYDKYLQRDPYSMDKSEKEKFLTQSLKNLYKKHYLGCAEYKNIMDAFGFDIKDMKSYYDMPFLPVRLFKEFELKSIPSENIIKVMTSSGTTGQMVSKIYLDRNTSVNQTRVLTKIVSSYLGKERLPMIILDSKQVIKNRSMFSARGAGIIGFSMFGRDRFFALDDDMCLDVDGMKQFLKKHEGEDIFLFGFTFMIWKHFYQELNRMDYHPDLSKGVLIHGGGWKKMNTEKISAEKFKTSLHSVCGIQRVYDYYGMVEQTGTIYMECEYGHLHTSNFSDVIIRNPQDLSVAEVGEEGIIEVVSVLPESYPGHALLTEDCGVLLGEDTCPCGRKGKYFKIKGRIKNAEIRGCSDTYASKF